MPEEVSANETEHEEQSEEHGLEINAIHLLAKRMDADVFVVTGHIDYILADQLIDTICYIEQQRPNAAVFLCTYGGDPDAAYIIARTLQEEYSRTTLYISGFCKSAGTLIVLGANEIVMGNKGELGPLDVQLPKEDSLISRSSGLDSFKSINVLHKAAFEEFEKMFLQLIHRSQGVFSTRTAAKIATELVVGLLAPIAAQIDPIKLTENQRALDISQVYGLRLTAKGLQASEKNINKLVYGYPSHSHVIDLHEAKQIFGECVRPFNELEKLVSMQAMLYMMKERGRESIREPIGTQYGENTVVHLNPVQGTHEAETMVSNNMINDRQNEEEEHIENGNREEEAKA